MISTTINEYETDVYELARAWQTSHQLWTRRRYPVVRDYDGNGTVTIGVYCNGSFYLRNTIGYADIVFSLGIPGDTPIAGNWDGLP